MILTWSHHFTFLRMIRRELVQLLLLLVRKDKWVEPLKHSASLLLLDWSLGLGFWFPFQNYSRCSSVLWSHWFLCQLLRSSAWTVWPAWSWRWLVWVLVLSVWPLCLHIQWRLYCGVPLLISLGIFQYSREFSCLNLWFFQTCRKLFWNHYLFLP